MTYKYSWKFNEINQCFRNILSSRLYSFSGSFKNDLGLCFQNHTCPWKDTLYSILSEFMQHRHTQGLVLFGTDGTQSAGQKSEWAPCSISGSSVTIPVTETIVCHSSRLHGKA